MSITHDRPCATARAYMVPAGHGGGVCGLGSCMSSPASLPMWCLQDMAEEFVGKEVEVAVLEVVRKSRKVRPRRLSYAFFKGWLLSSLPPGSFCTALHWLAAAVLFCL